MVKTTPVTTTKPSATRRWLRFAAVGLVVIPIGLAAVVLLTRWFLGLEFMQHFLEMYPGEYPLPIGAPVGFPVWLNWQHFFNTFLLVLIIRSGLQVRRQRKAPLFWASRRSKTSNKISIILWLHQALDLLWLINGAVFIALLFVTGQWLRIVPTSWSVFPNALSAALQYASLNWPTENGWVNYNALQQLAYFTVTFLAAPLAIVSGVRMSGVWPKKASTINALFPVEWARRVHYPVMVFFVLFIVVHVTLVLATGALRNLNHMYAAQGSTDPSALGDSWAGFWIFAASLAIIAAGWFAARPIVVAPIAGLFGRVSSR